MQFKNLLKIFSVKMITVNLIVNYLISLFHLKSNINGFIDVFNEMIKTDDVLAIGF